ncbi:ATP-dependent nuclease [Neorhizobium alkalisoli]|uniref:ATP-dependent nuclease n=1 Tax=Neorhizobium alkalisoli TaxID=528178 RepID=UPI000CF9718B|nr:AAA family ATPase [Neorhizobium alkalisoli]
MYLQTVTITGFRIFDEFKVDLDKSLNLIVGENNSGKTALIDAIRYALTARSVDWVRIQDSDFRHDQTKFSIQLKFAEISTRQAAVFVEHLTHEEIAGTKRSVLYLNFQAEQTDQLIRGNRFIRTDVRSGATGEGPSIEREVRDYLAATYLRPLRDAEAELMGGRGSRLAQVLQASDRFREAGVIDNLLQALIDANGHIIANAGIEASLSRIKRQLQGLDFSGNPLDPIIEIVGGTDLAKLSPVARKQMFRSILERLQLLIDQSDRNQGLGYSNLLFMATELLLLEQEHDDFPLLLIEEPEAHLHPQLQMKFLKAIREDFGGEGKPPLQSVLTTHSPNLASKAPLGNIIVMSGGKAFPMRAGSTALDPNDYVFLEKFLDVTKANLFFARGVIVVEGDGENILVPTIAKLLGCPLEDFGVSVVNVGSTAFARFAKVFQQKGLDDVAHSAKWLPTKVVCLRDLDLWPEKAKLDAGNPSGFQVWKEKNKQYWESYYIGNAAKRKAWVDNKHKPAGQNVRVELSDVWTFEYALICHGLAAEIYDTIPEPTVPFADLPADAEERAIAIFGAIVAENGKTRTAYALSQRLEKDFTPVLAPPAIGETAEQTEARDASNQALQLAAQTALRAKLPSYLLRAIDFVTGQKVVAAGDEAEPAHV